MKYNIALISKREVYFDLLNQLPNIDKIFFFKTIDEFNANQNQENPLLAIFDSDILDKNFKQNLYSIILYNSNYNISLHKTDNILFIPKPFLINDLSNKIEQAARNLLEDNKFITFSDYKVNLKARLFITDGISINLTEKETLLIEYLHKKKDFVTREELLENIWYYKSDINTHTIETHIYRLRKKISDGAIITDGSKYRLAF